MSEVCARRRTKGSISRRCCRHCGSFSSFFLSLTLRVCPFLCVSASNRCVRANKVLSHYLRGPSQNQCEPSDQRDVSRVRNVAWRCLHRLRGPSSPFLVLRRRPQSSVDERRIGFWLACPCPKRMRLSFRLLFFPSPIIASFSGFFPAFPDFSAQSRNSLIFLSQSFVSLFFHQK